MTQEQFEALGIEKSLAKKAADASADELKGYVTKEKYDAADQQRQQAETAVTDYKTQLETLKASAGDNEALKQQIADHCTEGSAHNGDIISQAPMLMALTYISGRSGYERDGSFSTTRGEAWECFDAGVAAEAFCLAAWEKGLGTCIMGIYDEKKVAAFLELPEGIRVGALIPVGYPADEPTAPKRKDVDMLLAFR